MLLQCANTDTNKEPDLLFYQLFVSCNVEIYSSGTNITWSERSTAVIVASYIFCLNLNYERFDNSEDDFTSVLQNIKPT